MARNTRNVSDEVSLAVIANDIAYIKKDIADIKDTVSKNYITREEFDPIKKVVYGLVSLILIGVVGALMALIINK